MIVDSEELNGRAIFFGIVFIIFIGVFIWSIIPAQAHKIITPINNTSSKVEVYKIVYVTVTPTPDNINYFASEYDNGTRKMLRPFTFYRENVSGYQSMKITSEVYDYKIFPSFHWFNDADYTYYETIPPNPNDEFLFVFFNMYADDISGNYAGLYLPLDSMFSLRAGNNMYQADTSFPQHLRIEELENSYTLDDATRIKPFGYTVQYSKDIQYAQTAGMMAYQNNYLQSGKSNAFDGYVLFEIPKGTNPQDIYFAMRFGNIGNANWKMIK
jgi:hypothetical protein